MWVTLRRDLKPGANVDQVLEDLGVRMELVDDMRTPDEDTWGLSTVAIEGSQAAMDLGSE